MGKKKSKSKGGLPQLNDDDPLPFGEGREKSRSFGEIFDPALFDQELGMTEATEPSCDIPRKKRLQVRPEAELDLHGLTAQEAELKVKNFLMTARLKGLKAVRIITGKGLHSPDLPVLPEAMEGLVREMKRGREIKHYAWENGRRERSGAMLIYL